MLSDTDQKYSKFFFDNICNSLTIVCDILYNTHDVVSDVVESGVQWRPNFQIGSRVLKKIRNLFICISMAYNVISCIEVAEITQTLKIADFTM